MKLLENLKRVKSLLSDESAWTKRVYAKDAKGYTIATKDDKACSWCLAGAIYKSSDTLDEINNVIECLKQFTGQSVCYYNDKEETQHQDIINLLDTAIASCIEV